MGLLSRDVETAQLPTSHHRPSNRRPQRANLPAVAIIAPVALAAIVLGAFRLARPGTLPNLRLAGISVGGLKRGDLRKVVALRVCERSGERGDVWRGGGGGGPRGRWRVSR